MLINYIVFEANFMEVFVETEFETKWLIRLEHYNV